MSLLREGRSGMHRTSKPRSSVSLPSRNPRCGRQPRLTVGVTRSGSSDPPLLGYDAELLIAAPQHGVGMLVASERYMVIHVSRSEPTARATMISRTVRVAGRPTSLRIESAIWGALEDVAAREGKPVDELLTKIDETRTASTLSSAISVFLVDYYRRAAALWRAGRQ